MEDIPSQERKTAVDRFNHFVRNEFKESIEARLGHISCIPYWIALLCFMPLNVESPADVLGCDGAACAVSAKAEGYPDEFAFFLGLILDWGVGCFLIFPMSYPLMLWGMTLCKAYIPIAWIEFLASWILIIVTYYTAGCVWGITCGFVSNAFAMGGYWWLGLVVNVVVLLACNYYLFVVRAQHTHQKNMPKAVVQQVSVV